jgi:AraC-like DNA-binding protein
MYNPARHRTWQEVPVLRYVIETGRLNEVLSRLTRLFDIRITFFDMEGAELRYFDIKEMSPFCRRLRSSTSRERTCTACDWEHLEAAKQRREVHVYRCHMGLFEGIVPLYEARGIYLGAVVFGQLRPPDARPPEGLGRKLAGLYRRLPECTAERMEDIAGLLAWTAEHVVRGEMVRFRNRTWAEELDRHISANLGGRITVRDLARAVRRSASFVSHRFRSEFGTSVVGHVRRKRMEAARRMLESGEYVYRVAEKLGFYDAGHFSKAFKAFFGHPPVECRRSGGAIPSKRPEA